MAFLFYSHIENDRCCVQGKFSWFSDDIIYNRKAEFRYINLSFKFTKRNILRCILKTYGTWYRRFQQNTFAPYFTSLAACYHTGHDFTCIYRMLKAYSENGYDIAEKIGSSVAEISRIKELAEYPPCTFLFRPFTNVYISPFVCPLSDVLFFHCCSPFSRL